MFIFAPKRPCTFPKQSKNHKVPQNLHFHALRNLRGHVFSPNLLYEQMRNKAQASEVHSTNSCWAPALCQI